MNKMILFIKEQLINMGYPENSITVEKTEGGKWGVTGYNKGEKAEASTKIS